MKRRETSEAQDLAYNLHRLDQLARLHVGYRATVAYRDGQAAVWLEGRRVAAGSLEAVIEAITSKGGRA